MCVARPECARSGAVGQPPGGRGVLAAAISRRAARAALAPSTFPTLRRTSTGEGRLRPYRWVDEDGVAWPIRLEEPLAYGLPFSDDELGVDCAVRPTAEGLRCLPRLDQTLTGSFGSPDREQFADSACTERIVAGPSGDEGEGSAWVFEREPVEDACRVEAAGTTPIEGDAPVVRAWTVGEVVTGERYSNGFDDTCRRELNSPRGVYRRLGDPVPLSTFAPVQVALE